MHALLALIPRPLVYAALAAIAAGMAGYVKGCSDEHARFVVFQAQVEAIGKAAEARRAQRIQDQKRVNKEVVHELETNAARLRRHNDTLLASVQQHARRSHLPPARPPAPGDRADGRARVPPGVACFAWDQLDRGIGGALSRFGERAGASAGRGDAALLALVACIDHAKRQGALGAQ